MICYDDHPRPPGAGRGAGDAGAVGADRQAAPEVSAAAPGQDDRGVVGTNVSRSPVVENAPERHPATASVWHWLERGDGARRSYHSKQTIAALLQALDSEFIAWEKDRHEGGAA